VPLRGRPLLELYKSYRVYFAHYKKPLPPVLRRIETAACRSYTGTARALPAYLAALIWQSHPEEAKSPLGGAVCEGRHDIILGGGGGGERGAGGAGGGVGVGGGWGSGGRGG